jgi:hypothetical protein
MMAVEFPCFWCRNKADRIGYFSKFYPELNRGTRENPTLFCAECWPIHKHEIGQVRGGMEGVWCLTFDSIGRLPARKIGWMVSKKGFEINHLSTLGWKKKIWRIHLKHQPKKKGVQNEADRNDLQGFPVQEQIGGKMGGIL